MKRFFWVWCLFTSVNTFAQNRTNVWELGYSLYSAPKCEAKYSNGDMNIFGVSRAMTFFTTNASICDTSGNLLFYSNGITIEDRNYDTLQNSLNFNPGWATEFNDPFGLNICQGILIIPEPENDQRFYLFHESGEEVFANNLWSIQPLHLGYSVIDMNLNAGFGGIVDSLKNKHAIDDTLLYGGLTAVKHANGRDWWIITHDFHSEKYFKLLLTPEGIQGPFEQTIGPVFTSTADYQATFSPDGSKYCLSSLNGRFDYMIFDRCTGEFSDPISVFSPDSFFYGNSFSPNGRFIYASSQVNLYQYDTWNPDMATYPIHIAAWDSFVNPDFDIPVLFFMHQLAPDGKIYVSPWNGVEYLNVLKSPDSLGLSCNFVPHSFILNDYNYTNNIPTFPNYDLGALENSPCDTIGDPVSGILAIEKSSFSISPNPAKELLNIIYNTKEDCLLTLYDINGKQVASVSLFHYFKNRLLNVSELPPGVYLAAVSCKGERIWSEKVVVQR